jgi:hypothetical protein
MERQPIKSSNIKSAGYDGSVMEVEFADGKVYEVADVTPDMYARFLGTASKGSWYHKNVKEAGLPVRRKVEDKPE